MFWDRLFIIIGLVFMLAGTAQARDFKDLIGVDPQLRYFFGTLSDTEIDTLNGATAGTPTDIKTATYGVTAAESGATIFINAAAGKTMTLPAPASGLRYKFVLKAQPTSGNHIVATNAAAAIVEGMVDVNNVKVLAANEKQINFVASTAIVGDWISLISDGTSWFLTGESGGGAGAITVTAP